MALENRDQPGGDPQREEEPGGAIDAGEGGPERREQSQDAKQPGGEPAAAAGPTVAQYRQTQAQDEEDQQIRQGDQPDEMAAHPVELVEVDRVLAQHDRHDLERSGDKAAPERQDEDLMGRSRPAARPGSGEPAVEVSGKTSARPIIIMGIIPLADLEGDLS